MKRRWVLAAAAAALLAGPALAARDVAEVYKGAACGCCGKWIEHLRAGGFEVRAHDVPDLAASRAKLGVPAALGSCHTARIGGYLVEGHVPAQDIRRLLADRPRAAGLAVPGMPQSAPGMDAGSNDPYEVLLFQPDGGRLVYRRYGSK